MTIQKKQKNKAEKPKSTEKLIIRHATRSDVPDIIAMMRRAYPNMTPYTNGHLLGQVTVFQQGQFVADYDGKIVGYAATFRIDEATALSKHKWAEITGGGYASRHDPSGPWLYGMEVCVDPDWRGLRIGQRLYEARKRLAEELELKGIVFGGRMPGLSKKMKEYKTADAYLEAIKEQKIRDPVITFQINNGFEPIGVLKNYLPSDRESLGYAAHLVWRNPYVDQDSIAVKGAIRPKDWVRVATVQFQQRAVSSFDEFISNIEYFVDVVSDYKSDFVVFPELFTLQLLALEKKRIGPIEAIETLTKWTEPFVEALREMALSYNINIIV
jgi:GNAT superfamily N-acetyltransferase